MQGTLTDRRYTVAANGVGVELAIVTLFFCAFFAVYFSPVWWTGALLAPGDAAISYFPLFHQPWGLISDRLLLGYPVGADLQVQANYPLKLLLPTYNAFVISAYVVMAVGTYAFLAAYAESRVGALLGAIVAASGGFMIAHLGHATIIHAACWIPWLMWSLHCGSQRLNWAAVCVGALAVCLSLLGGHPQISIIGFGFAAVFWIFLCLLARIEHRPMGGIVRHGACVFALGLMLSAISVVPFAELATQGVRAGWSFADFDTYSNTPRSLLLGIFPGIFGTFPTAFYGPYTGPWNLTELAFYAGIGPLVLAGIGVLTGLRNPHVWFWAGVAVVAILISMGASTPLGVVMYHLPVVRTFRAQGRFGFIFIIAVATLVAFAVRAFRTGSVRMPQVLLSGLGMLVVTACGLWLVFHIYPALGSHPSDVAGDVVGSMARNPAILIPCALLVAMVALLIAWTLWRRAFFLVLVGVLTAVDLASFGMFYEWRFAGLTPETLEMSDVTKAQVKKVRASGTRVLPLEDSQLVYGPFSPQVNVAFGVPLAVNYGPLLPSRAQRFAQLDPIGHPHFDVMRSALPDILGVGWFARAPGGSMFGNVLLSRGCGGDTTADNVRYSIPMAAKAASVRIVSHMACSTLAVQNEQVATVRWSGPSGSSQLPLLAGVDTAEWAIDRPGLVVSHRRAQVVESFDAPGAPGNYYVTSLVLDGGADAAITELSLELAGHGQQSLRARSVELVDSQGHATKLEPLRPGLTIDDSNPAVSLARRNVSPPLQWSVCRSIVMGKADIQSSLSGGSLPDGSSFLPHSVALLEHRHAPAAAPECTVPATLTGVSRDAGRFRAEVDGRGSSILVVSQAWYPGWSAHIDGERASIFPVDGLIQGVMIPSGKHAVELTFRPLSFVIGLILSLMAILLLLAPFVRRRGNQTKLAGDR
jgi:hypothetical protein